MLTQYNSIQDRLFRGVHLLILVVCSAWNISQI